VEIERLRAAGFRVTPSLVEAILKEAGEQTIRFRQAASTQKAAHERSQAAPSFSLSLSPLPFSFLYLLSLSRSVWPIPCAVLWPVPQKVA